MKPATLIFLINKKTNQICLGMKKRRFGAGKWNGYGGKVDEGEEVIDAAIRELKEEAETTVNKEDLTQVAVLDFRFPHNSDWHQQVTVYLTYTWTGDPVETEEMRPEWFGLDKIPYENMWPDDILWLSKVIGGEKLSGEFIFDENEKIIEHKLDLLCKTKEK